MMEQEELFLYQACGLLKMKIYQDADKKYFGILEQDKQENSKPLDLVILKKIEIQLNKKFSFSELVNSGKPLICLVYPRTGREFQLRFCILRNLYLNESEAPYEVGTFKIRGKVRFINYDNQAVSIKVVPLSENIKDFQIAIKYQDINRELKDIKCRQYWEFDCLLVNNQFTIESAKKIKDKKDSRNTTIDAAPSQPPTIEKQRVKEQTKEENETYEAVTQEAPIKSPVVNVAKLIEPQQGNLNMVVRSEVVIKISGALPQATPAPNKKVIVEVTDQNGINFTAIINGKSWKKAEANVAEFADWGGAISGKLGKTEQGLEIIDAGIQIFEKKPKELKKEENPS